jgi:hypothetical protein
MATRVVAEGFLSSKVVAFKTYISLDQHILYLPSELPIQHLPAPALA